MTGSLTVQRVFVNAISGLTQTIEVITDSAIDFTGGLS
jgi:hypothetical protein